MSAKNAARLGNRNERPMEHAVTRSLAALTMGVVRQTQGREARRAQLALAETELQYQERIAGSAGNVVDTSTLTLEFETPFYFSPGTRDSELDVPQFSYGVNIEAGTGVIINAHVTSWTRDPENDSVTGGAIEIGAVCPGLQDTNTVDFTAVVHLSFEGYSARVEDESEMA